MFSHVTDHFLSGSQTTDFVFFWIQKAQRAILFSVGINICMWHVPTVPGFETIVMYFGHITVWQMDWILTSNGEIQPELHSPFQRAHSFTSTKHPSKSTVHNDNKQTKTNKHP